MTEETFTLTVTGVTREEYLQGSTESARRARYLHFDRSGGQELHLEGGVLAAGDLCRGGARVECAGADQLQGPAGLHRPGHL